MTKPIVRHESLRSLALESAATSTVIPPPRETVSIDAAVALGDIPILIERPTLEADDLELGRLLDAIDGYSNVASVAERARLDPQQARALLADLAQHGFVALDRRVRTASGVEPLKPPAENKTLDYWLQGMRPRTR
jgi:hypothetical protein